MDSASIHERSIVIDGLIVSKWSRAVFEDMRKGGVSAANCTCSVWEGFRATMENIARWKTWIDGNDDLLVQVRSAADIRRAKEEGRVGIILGWQNTSAIEDRLDFLRLFHDLGVRVVQLTYNTQNLVGSGCLESNDGGLSDFGREAVAEMNRLGIVIDLSHVGTKTAEDAILCSRQPVCFTHCAPAALFAHARNKTDAQLRFLVEHGGFVGASTYPPFLPRGNDSTVDDCVAVIEHVIGVAGEDNVGIGTDFTQDQDQAFFDWVAHDKGTARRILVRKGGLPRMPAGFERLSDYGNVTAAMVRRGWPQGRIEKVLGGNWLRFLGEVWRA